MTISQLYMLNHRFHSPLVKTYFTITSHIFHLPLQGVYLRPTFELSRQSRCGLYWSCSSGQKAAWVDKIFISKSWDLVPEAGVSINFKTWVFYKGWFPRFGFFISRPYVVFYKMKVVFIKKKSAHFIHFNYFWSQNRDFAKCDICINQNRSEMLKLMLPFLISLTIGCWCHFGFWPLGRVGFEATFNLIRPEFFFIKLAEFFINLQKIGVF